MEYWLEHAGIAMDEAGLSATQNQLAAIAGVIESAHEFYGQTMGHDVASANWVGEQKRQHAAEIKALEVENEATIARADKLIKAAQRGREQAIWRARDAQRELAELQRNTP
jgi:uridine phosphorylase